MPYKKLSSFENIKRIFGEPGTSKYGYTATPMVPSEKDKSFDDDVFLLYRRSESSMVSHDSRTLHLKSGILPC